MKILGIDVNRNGIRIPFTHYRIPIPIFVSGLISIFGVPTAASKHMESTGNSLMTNDTCLWQGGNQFAYQTQASCSYLSMQYFDNCFMETAGTFQSIDPNLKTVQQQVQLACRTIDGIHRNNDALLLYNGSFLPEECPHGSFSMTTILQMRDSENCFIESPSFFQSIDPNLKTFQCKAKLSCGTNRNKFYPGLKEKDLLVLYRSVDEIIDNQLVISPVIQPWVPNPPFKKPSLTNPAFKFAEGDLERIVTEDDIKTETDNEHHDELSVITPDLRPAFQYGDVAPTILPIALAVAAEMFQNLTCPASFTPMYDRLPSIEFIPDINVPAPHLMTRFIHSVPPYPTPNIIRTVQGQPHPIPIEPLL